METDEEMTARFVAQGAALLDKRNARWAEKIDISTLDMASPCCCILGQLYQRYGHGVICLGLEDSAEFELGFEVFWEKHPGRTGRGGAEYLRLQALWVDEINKRLETIDG